MKINEINMFIVDDRIIVGVKNKRGQIKNPKLDVTEEVVDWFVNSMVSDNKSYFVHTINGKPYSINCSEISSEKYEAILKNKRKSGEKAYKNIMSLFASTYMYQLLGR